MEAVIFDRDGVIIDSESVNIDSAVDAFKQLGIKIKRSEKNYIVGRHPEDYKRFFLKKYHFSYEKFREIQRENYYELLESAPLFEKTVSLIKKLHEMEIPLALNTSSSLKSTLQVLKKSDLENIFDVIVTFEDYKKRKPDPESYIIATKKLNVSPKRCVAIEDSAVGLAAAKNTGMKCIIIPNKYTKSQDFTGAYLVVNSADKIDIDLLNQAI